MSRAIVLMACASFLMMSACLPPGPDPLCATISASPGEDGSLWYRTRGESKLDLATGVAVDVQGNVYLGAHQQSPGQLFTDMVVYQFAPDGTEKWSTRWGGVLQEKAFVVAVNGPTVYVGGLQNTGVDPRDANMAVIALDANDGHKVWEFTWGQGYGYQEVDGLVVDGNAIYVSGWTTGQTTSTDLAILKLDLAGNLIWAQTWGGSTWDQADGQLVVDAEFIYVCGRYDAQNYVLGGKGLLAKFSKATGQYVAHCAWGDSIFTDALGMTSDGTWLYVVGLTIVGNNNGQIFLRKYDKALNLVWERLWGGRGGESSRALAVDADGDIVVAGHSDSCGSGANDVVLLRYSPEGELRWARLWGGSAIDSVGGIALFGPYAYLGGETFSFGAGDNDALLIKANSRTGAFPKAQ